MVFGVLQFDGHDEMVDSNEMFVNEAIHQGTDMRHPMCPNAIFRIPQKGPQKFFSDVAFLNLVR